MAEAEIEKRARIRLSLAAYAYEVHDDPIMSDAEFDELARRVRPEVGTGDRIHDEFFAREFSADTGQWIHKHPFPGRLEWLYQRSKNWRSE